MDGILHLCHSGVRPPGVTSQTSQKLLASCHRTILMDKVEPSKSNIGAHQINGVCDWFPNGVLKGDSRQRAFFLMET